MEASFSWAARLGTLLGGPPDELDAASIERLVADQVREAPDLDFKSSLYSRDRDGKKDLAGDVAAMANTRGGLIILGVKDEEEAAAEATPVDLSGEEERRMTQIVAADIAPYLEIEIVPIEVSSGVGFYLLLIPPSIERPHAVVSGTALRYPRRDGTTTRWLTESEVAAMYRDRASLLITRSERAGAITDASLRPNDASIGPWISVTLVPERPGRMTINAEKRKEIADWGKFYKQPPGPDFTAGFLYDRTAGPPNTIVGMEHFLLAGAIDSGTGPRSAYAELYTDGSGVAAWPEFSSLHRIEDHIQRIALTGIVPSVAQALRILVAHARENCGAFGSAVALIRLQGKNMQLVADLMGHGFVEPVGEGAVVYEPVENQITVSLEAIYGSSRELLSATSNLLSDIFHAFGISEVLPVKPDGTIRSGWMGRDDGYKQWAEENGVPVSDERVSAR